MGPERVRRKDQKSRWGGERARKGPDTRMQTEREIESEGRSRREQLAASSCCDLSALTGMSRANMHLPCPLGQFPWKRYLSPIHIYCTLMLLTPYSRQSACGSNGPPAKVDNSWDLSWWLTCSTVWVPVVQTSDLWGRDSMSLRLEPQFTHLSHNGAILICHFKFRP